MKIYGYHRTSTKEQHLDRGINEIEDYCNKNNLQLERIFTDQQTGTNFSRPRYTVLKEDVLRSGDYLIITEIDRLGRRKDDTLKELQELKAKGVRVMVLEIPTTLIDLTSMGDDMAKTMLDLINNLMIEIYTTMAQAELEKKKKRQEQGIAAKKARGEWNDYGRPRAMDFDKFCKAYKSVVNGEKRPFELMRELDLKVATFYRYKRKYEERMQSHGV